MAAGEAQYLRRASAAERKDRAQPKAEDLSQAAHSMIAAQTQAAAQMLALTSEMQGLTRHTAALSTSSSDRSGVFIGEWHGRSSGSNGHVCGHLDSESELLSKWSALDST